MDELRELGVSTGAATGGAPTADAKTGLLTLDENALDRARSRRIRSALASCSAPSGTDGFAQRVEGVLKSYVGSTGSINERIKQSDEPLARTAAQMTAEDTRLATREARLKAQFAAMESALGTAQTQQAGSRRRSPSSA